VLAAREEGEGREEKKKGKEGKRRKEKKGKKKRKKGGKKRKGRKEKKGKENKKRKENREKVFLENLGKLLGEFGEGFCGIFPVFGCRRVFWDGGDGEADRSSGLRRARDSRSVADCGVGKVRTGAGLGAVPAGFAARASGRERGKTVARI
jgi:hypothetical protein